MLWLLPLEQGVKGKTTHSKKQLVFWQWLKVMKCSYTTVVECTDSGAYEFPQNSLDTNEELLTFVAGCFGRIGCYSKVF